MATGISQQAHRQEVPVLGPREFVPTIRLIEACPVPNVQASLVAQFAPQFKARFAANMSMGKGLFPVFYEIMTALDAHQSGGSRPMDTRKVAKS